MNIHIHVQTFKLPFRQNILAASVLLEILVLALWLVVLDSRFAFRRFTNTAAGYIFFTAHFARHRHRHRHSSSCRVCSGKLLPLNKIGKWTPHLIVLMYFASLGFFLQLHPSHFIFFCLSFYFAPYFSPTDLTG